MKKIIFVFALLLCSAGKLFANVTDNGQTVTIPVVVHIFYSESDPKYTITKEQVLSQIVAMNKDYSATNADYVKLQQFDNMYGTSFVSKAAGPPNFQNGMGIQFALAQRNDNNEGTTGIEYIEFSGSFAAEYGNGSWNIGSYAWNTQKFLNIFVAPVVIADGDTVRGASYNGITAIRYTCFGTLDAGSPFVPPNFILDPQYKEGGIGTHEVGHALTLQHPFPFDNQIETPSQPFPNYGCNEPYVQNNNITASMNFMDYTDDPCIYMFVKGQRISARSFLFTTGQGLIDPSVNNALQPALCSKPAFVNAQAVPGQPKVTLSWQGLPSDQFRVKIYYLNTLVFQQEVTGTSVMSDNLSYDQFYYAKVYKKCADQGYSEPVISEPFIIYTPCPLPVNLALSLTDENVVHAGWSSPGGVLSSTAAIYKKVNGNLVEEKESFNQLADFSSLEYSQEYKVTVKSNCENNESAEIFQFIKTCSNDVFEPNDNASASEPIPGLTTPGGLSNGIDMNVSICKMTPLDEDWYYFFTAGTNFANVTVKTKNEPAGSPLDMYLYRQSGVFFNNFWIPNGSAMLTASTTGNTVNQITYRPCGGTRFKWFVRVVKDPNVNLSASSIDAVINAKLFWDFSPVCLPPPQPFRVNTDGTEKDFVNIYPNPGNGIFNIESGTDIHSITVTDLYGKTIIHQDVNDSNISQIDLSVYAGGVYLVYVNGNISRPVKIVKQ